MSVLIHTHGFLGDFICSEPSIRAIAKKHSGQTIKVKTPFPEFLRHVPYSLEITQESGEPDYVLINPQGGNANLVDAVAVKYGLKLESRIPDLNIPHSKNNHGDYFLLCSEASTKERHWAPGRWEELVENLPHRCIQVGKWAKNPIAKADTSLLGQKLSPEDLASLVRHSKAFITVDTGLSHFAPAVGKACIVLMDRVPVAWRAHEGYTHAIHKDGINNITVKDVLTELESYAKNIHAQTVHCHPVLQEA